MDPQTMFAEPRVHIEQNHEYLKINVLAEGASANNVKAITIAQQIANNPQFNSTSFIQNQHINLFINGDKCDDAMVSDILNLLKNFSKSENPLQKISEILGPIGIRNQHHVRRRDLEEELENLIKEVTKNQPSVVKIAITGLSGMGVSEFAKEFVYRKFADKIYDYAFYISGSILRIRDDLKTVMSSIGMAFNEINEETCSQFYNRFNDLEKQHITKILLLVDNVSEFEKIKKFFPLNFSGRNCQYHLIVVSQQNNIEEFDTIKVDNFNERDIKELFSLPMVEKLANPQQVRELCNTLQGYPLLIMAALSTIKKIRTLTIQKYLNEFRKFTIVDLEEKPIYPWDGSTRLTKLEYSSIGKIETALSFIFEKIKLEFPKSFDLLGYLSVFNIGDIPIKFIAELMKLEEIEFGEILSTLYEFSMLDCNREHQNLVLNRLVGICYKKLYPVSYSDKSYLAQKAINDKFINMINSVRGSSKNHMDFKYPWHQVENLIHHAILVGSRMVQSFHNSEDIEMLCNAFYYVGLYHLFNNNYDGVLLAIKHLNLVMGDCAYSPGTLFDGKDHMQGKIFLSGAWTKLYQSKLNKDVVLYKWEYSDPKNEYIIADESLVEALQKKLNNTTEKVEESKEQTDKLAISSGEITNSLKKAIIDNPESAAPNPTSLPISKNTPTNNVQQERPTAVPLPEPSPRQSWRIPCWLF